MTILGITCQRDDGPFLGEWLAHHLAAGFDHMLVLSHECADGSDALLDALAQDARITHLPFQPKGKKSVQWQALQLIADHPLYKDAGWALFFDCDEYLVLPETDLHALIAALDGCDALALPWRLFGSGGQGRRTQGLTPERFTACAPTDLQFPLGHLFKTLHRPGAFQKPGVHRPRRKKAQAGRWFGPDLRPLPGNFAAQDKAMTLYGQPLGPRKVWLNHYSLRSAEEFIVKRARGLPNHQDREIGVTYWAERNWNAGTSEDILPMMPATRKELDQLMALPDVQRCFDHAMSWHRAKYEALMQDIDVVRLEFRLHLLTGSTPPTAQMGRAFLQAQSRLLTKQVAT